MFYDEKGRLSLEADPKEIWAKNNPDFFPVDINAASKYHLLRVPGLGPITVGKILKMRKIAPIRTIEDISRPNVRLNKAAEYLYFGHSISANKSLFL